MYRGKILWLEDNVNFLDTYADELEFNGYQVLKAHTTEEAREALDAHWGIDLIILDISLKENDADDTSGLDWGDQETYGLIPKIVITAYPNIKTMRQALRVDAEGPLAIDYLEKDEIDVETLLRKINDIFANKIEAKPHLKMRWAKDSSSSHIASLIEPNITHSEIGDCTKELEGLLHRLFQQADTLILNRLLSSRKGRVALEVYTFPISGEMSSWVLILGQREIILDEITKYNELLPIGKIETSIDKSTETARLGGIIYGLRGTQVHNTQTLAELCQQAKATEIVPALRHLFEVTLSPLQGLGRSTNHQNPLTYYFPDFWDDQSGLFDRKKLQEHLEAQVAAIQRQANQAKLANLSKMRGVKAALDAEGVAQTTIKETQPYGLYYGCLKGECILVDEALKTWLIDFGQMESGPLLHDWYTLEIDLRLCLMKQETLQDRTKLERDLLKPLNINRYDNNAQSYPSKMQDIGQIIRDIRHCAYLELGVDEETYLTGLMLYALTLLPSGSEYDWLTRDELTTAWHILNLAATIHKKFNTAGSELGPDQSVQIDPDNRKVLLADNWIELSAQQFNLFEALYEQANDVISRSTIAELLGVTDEQDSRINVAMRRLREKIEPDLDKPQYIDNVWGQGYRLNVSSEPD